MCNQQLPIPEHTASDFWFDISAHLTSDIIFIAILSALSWILYYYTKRNKLYKFFCIKDTKRLNIYLSRLDIQRGGAFAVNGLAASYSGITTVHNEVIAANHFREKFNYISPSLSDKPGLLGKLLLSDVLVKSIVSVTTQNAIDTSTSLITLGSPAYNIVSNFVQSHPQSHVQFAANGASIIINGLPPITNITNGFVQRLYDRENKKSYFYAAGFSERGTTGAANFLAENWNILYKKYKGERNFLVVIDFPSPNLSEWNIVSETTW